MAKVLIGQHEMVDLMMAALFCNGHVLIEGVPGVAKTTAAKLLAKTLDLEFSRIQFTPDLMPADVTGTSIFNQKNTEFEFKKGPVFGNIVLIDEINRSPAKTQAALFEVMEEHQVTIDGTTHKVPQPFMVLATQNPIEQEGTYKLPEAQQDRFMMKINVNYPGLDEEFEILRRFSGVTRTVSIDDVKPVLNAIQVAEIRKLIDRVFIKDELLKYIAGVIQATRNHRDLYLGASPRAGLAIMRASRVIAAMNGRSFVTPDDIRQVTYPVLNHRLILAPESEMEGIELKTVVEEILKTVEVPR
jgi:MoxR-like ATPase